MEMCKVGVTRETIQRIFTRGKRQGRKETGPEFRTQGGGLKHIPRSVTVKARRGWIDEKGHLPQAEARARWLLSISRTPDYLGGEELCGN